MRVVLLALFAAAGTCYGLGAFYFWGQERRAQSVAVARETPLAELDHPEATLALTRERFRENDYSPDVSGLVNRVLRQVPAFYQAPLHLAVYHTNRLEEPERTLRAFEAAVRRYPSNGRLRLDYARWLLVAPSRLPPLEDPSSPGTLRDLRREGETQLGLALTLEPQLTDAGLETLGRRNVPAERWIEIVPDGIEPRRRLGIALAAEGDVDDALELLRNLVPRYEDARYCRQAAHLALSWGDPALALEAVDRWRELAARERPTGIEPHEAGLLTARAYLAQGKAEAAYDVFRETLETVSPSSRSGLKLLCAMGNEYLRRRQIAVAESIFSEAASYSPTYPDALLGLARIEDRAGNLERAIAQYDRLLRVDPDHSAARRELEALLKRRIARGRP